jgi:hypothetical protein
VGSKVDPAGNTLRYTASHSSCCPISSRQSCVFFVITVIVSLPNSPKYAMSYHGALETWDQRRTLQVVRCATRQLCSLSSCGPIRRQAVLYLSCEHRWDLWSGIVSLPNQYAMSRSTNPENDPFENVLPESHLFFVLHLFLIELAFARLYQQKIRLGRYIRSAISLSRLSLAVYRSLSTFCSTRYVHSTEHEEQVLTELKLSIVILEFQLWRLMWLNVLTVRLPERLVSPANFSSLLFLSPNLLHCLATYALSFPLLLSEQQGVSCLLVMRKAGSTSL